MASRPSIKSRHLHTEHVAARPRSEDQNFHLPLPGLFADLDAGRGAVALSDDFFLTDPLMRARVVENWLQSMRIERGKAWVEAFRQFVERTPDETIVFQIEHFRQLCVREGFDCPEDLPVLLQRF